MQAPMIDASIKFAPDEIATDIAANRESPAPVTSTGLTVNAGKFCLSKDDLVFPYAIKFLKMIWCFHMQ